MNYRIFLVEDDRSIADGLRHQLEQWDFAVQVVQNFRGVLGEFTAFDPHLVLMDIMLPCYDGYHWCREIRQVSQVPIIFLSSASDNMNLIMAMNMGGDGELAGQMVFVSTILAIVTLFLWIFFLGVAGLL